MVVICDTSVQGGGTHMREDDSAVRDSIEDAADRLFSRRGSAATSIRDILAASGQRNMAAIRYYFGDRNGLMHAVFRRRMSRLNEVRAKLLSELPNGSSQVELADLVRVAVLPLAEYVRSEPVGSDYARFAAQMTPAIDFSSYDLDAIGAANGQVITLLRSRLTHLPPSLAARRIDLMMQMMVAVFAAYEQRRDCGVAETDESLDDMVADLVEMLVAALEAPRGGYSPAIGRRE